MARSVGAGPALAPFCSEIIDEFLEMGRRFIRCFVVQEAARRLAKAAAMLGIGELRNRVLAANAGHDAAGSPAVGVPSLRPDRYRCNLCVCGTYGNRTYLGRQEILTYRPVRDAAVRPGV